MATMQERAELHKTIWKIANDLRGSIDGWEFKAYVLGSIFYRFISENICDYIHGLMKEAGQPDFDYATISGNKMIWNGTASNGVTFHYVFQREV